MAARRDKWTTPGLIVLSRSHAQESVLSVCKMAGQGPLSQVVNDTACTFDSVVTGLCSECAAVFVS